jgi:hypothetical protein
LAGDTAFSSTYLALSGGTLTGALTLSGNPTSALEAAPKQYVDAGYRFAGQIIYTSSSTFSKADPLGTGDIGLRAVRVKCQGAGGGGGGAATTAAGEVSVANGGAAGSYAESFLLATSLGSSETVTVGAGGAGGSAGANNGTAGANSSFGTLVVGDGGSGGAARAASSVWANFSGLGSGRTVTGTGQLVIPSSSGTLVIMATGSSFASNSSTSGGGGNSHLGSGGGSRSASGDGSGGTAYGGGAGGALNTESQATARSGGNGAAGIVIVELFI